MFIVFEFSNEFVERELTYFQDGVDLLPLAQW